MRSVKICVAGRPTEFLGFEVEDFRSVGFAKEKEAYELDENVGKGCDIENPAPSRVFRDETSHDRPNRWT